VKWKNKVPFDFLFLGNIPAKNYQNQLMQFEVVASQSRVVFLRHSVYSCLHGNQTGALYNLEVAADQQELMVLQHSMRPSIAHANGQLDPWCS